ncbi:MAG: trypsin-like peptidase domain-containing protein [Planctomycetes bacterium]|nr:trypsin-like peptidase domain-containing protein [Planctomycetota bacterium]
MRAVFTCLALPLLSVLLLSGVAEAQQALPRTTVDRLKAGTVFLKVSRGRRLLTTGSGFLVARDKTRGHVITNAHVVAEAGKPGSTLTAVFQSGSSSEWSCTASVLATDPERDLALVSVSGRQLPEPLALVVTDEARETLPVYVVGYPLGGALAAGDRNPSPSISRASIASLRKTPGGRVIQLDGELNPGNSGGPIVGPQGTLLGVAVAKIEGTNISFAIPVEAVAAFLRAQLVDLQIQVTQQGTLLTVRARLIDPCGQVRRAEVRVRNAKGAPPSDRKPISGQSAVFVADSAGLRAEIPVTPDEAATSYLVQTRVLLKDGGSEYSIPVVLAVAGATPKRPSSPAAGKGITSIAFPLLADQVVADPAGAGVFVIFRDPNKPNAPTKLVLWDLVEGKVITRIAVPLAPTRMAVVSGKLVVCCAESSVVVVVDPKTRKVVKAAEIAAKRGGKDLPPMRVCFDSPPGKAVIFCTDGERDRSPAIAVVDLETGRAELKSEFRTERLSFSGEHLILQDNFGGSPSGISTLLRASQLLDQEAAGPSGRRPPVRGQRVEWKARNVGPMFAIPGGFAYSTFKGKTHAYSTTNSKDLWEVEGVLLARSPTALYVSRTSTKAAAILDWPIAAIDPRTGRVLWERTLRLPQASSPQIERSTLMRYMPNVIVNAPWSVVEWAQNTTPWSVGAGLITTQAGVDRLVFNMSEWKVIRQMGPRGFRFAEVRRGWFSVPIESAKGAGAGSAPPPTTLHPGDSLSYRVRAQPRAGESFVVIQGPDGLSVDPKTGLVTWKPDMAGLGKHSIVIGLKAAGAPRSVFTFLLRIRP